MEALDDDALAAVSPPGWGVAATSAHLAFYDDWVAERWRRYLSAGSFQTLTDDITDVVNASGSRVWQALALDQASPIACRAAEELTELIVALPVRRWRRPSSAVASRWWTGHCTGYRTSTRSRPCSPAEGCH